MSGGHITGYNALPYIADEIERLAIEQPELGPDVLGRYRLAAEHARRAYEAIRAVDYMEGGDYGRESFVAAWDEYVKTAPGDVLVALSRPEGYGDVHPETLVDDAHIHPAFRARVIGGVA